MLIPVLLMLAIAAGGFGLTYLFENEESFLWRSAVGCVIGSAVFGMLAFVLSMLAGLNTGTALASLVITMAPILFVIRGRRRKKFGHDWAKAKGKLQGGNWRKLLPFLYYAAFAVLFVFFFDRTMIQADQGIFTGGSNNLGDLPFHLGAIFSFTDGANFPPENPSFSGAKFSYPFIADLITAVFMKLGSGLKDAMLVQNVSWAFALLIIFERFVFKLTGDRLAGRLAPALLFFSGGLGFIWFFGDLSAQGKGFFDFIWQIPKDYTIGDDFRWGNSLVTLFMTQRSLLIGMPITIVVLGGLWGIFTAEKQKREEGSTELSGSQFPLPTFLLGLVAGLLPLVHLHSLAALFVVTAFLFFLRPEKWREWISFGVGVSVLAVPQLIWSMSGSATETSKFFEWHFGWDAGKTNIVWFWIKNTGLLFPLIAAGIYLIFSTRASADAVEEKLPAKRNKTVAPRLHPTSLLLFYLPFVFLFLISNVAKLAPWEWDNIKVLIYWFVGSIPFAAFALAWVWRRGTALRVVAAACFIILIFSGGLDVWRTVSGQIKYRVFDPEAVIVAERIKRSTPAQALFLNAPTYNTAIALTGRRSLMRYPGHLGSHGIDFAARERDVKAIYAGGAGAEELMRKYGIEYVLISPEERALVAPNEQFFRKFPVVAEAGQYKVYKVQN